MLWPTINVSEVRNSSKESVITARKRILGLMLFAFYKKCSAILGRAHAVRPYNILYKNLQLSAYSPVSFVPALST